MASITVLQQMRARATQADEMIANLRSKLLSIKTAQAEKFSKSEADRLRRENHDLMVECQQLKKELIRVESKLGIQQVPLPMCPLTALPAVAPSTTTSDVEANKNTPDAVKQTDKKPEKKKPTKTKGGNQQPVEELPIDISRLNMKVGHIVSVKKHPDADSLYVEEVDLGEDRNRTIVSGLVKHIPIEQMQDRKAVFLCNLKPAKMRGILSEGMIMCASTPEKVEIIEIPSAAEKGDSIVVHGFSGTPDVLLNPKKKVWEQVQPDLKINTEGKPTYKGVPWNILGKGECQVPTMRECGIK